MSIRSIYVLALCVGFATHTCFSAAVHSEDKQLAKEESEDTVVTENGQLAENKDKTATKDKQPVEEENKDKVKTGDGQSAEEGNEDKDVKEDEQSSEEEKKNNEGEVSSTQSTVNTLKEDLKPEDSSSSKEKTHQNSKNKDSDNSSSKEKTHQSSKSKDSDSSESDDSSSEEKSHKKTKHKRSLDSKQDSLNTIGDGSNQTSTKESSSSVKDETHILETEVLEPSISSVKDVTPDIHPDPTTASETSTIASLPETTADLSHTVESETTEVESETTTETETETEVTESETTSEAETVENTPETTSESQPETEEGSESDAITTTETSSSEDESEEPPPSVVSSSPSTEVGSPKPDEEQTFMEMAMDRVHKLSDQIRLLLMQYRKDHVVVLPGQKFFPDPMPMQDFKQSFSIGTMDFKNVQVFGLSNFTVEHINTDVDKMQVYILLHMKRLLILGNYTLKTFFSRAAGPFNVTLLDVDSEGIAEIETTTAGHLEATDSVMDMFTQDMRVDFKNLGFMGSMFQGMVSAVGDALFNSIKPQILQRVNLVIRTDVNKKLKDFSVKFINKVSPVELAFSEGRKYARSNGYDPYSIRDHTFILGGLVYINITEFWVEGLSKFYRVGNLTISMDSGVLQVGVHVMTQKLTGRCVWSGQTFGIVKSGKTNFTVDHLQVRALVNQSLDIRKKPQLEDLDLELGWVKVTMDSPMTLNLMIEGIINAFPRLIRHIIVDTLEQPLKEKIQEILNKVNVESFVDDHLPKLDSFGL